jgi:N-methylhydantoinase A
MAHVSASGNVRIAVDIGGTFTDIVLMKPNGVLSESKVSTTPDNPSRAVIAGVLELLRDHGVPPTDVAEVLHGTTVGSNHDFAAARRQDGSDHDARFPRRA